MNYLYVNSVGRATWVSHQNTPVPEHTVHEVPDGAQAKDYYLIDGEVRKYTEEQLIAKHNPPGHACAWNDATMGWVDQRTLSDAKINKNIELNQKWFEANNTGFPYMDKVFATDQSSRSDIDGINGYVSLKGAMPDEWVGVWKAKDNTFIDIVTVDDWKNFYSAMVKAGNDNFIKAQALKHQLNVANTIPDVEIIDW